MHQSEKFSAAEETRTLAYSSAIRGQSCAIQRRRNFSLAKVGVEGSNPFARSKFPNHFSILAALSCFRVWRPHHYVATATKGFPDRTDPALANRA